MAAYDGSRLVGFGRVVSDRVLHAMIYDMIVLPGYQGKGIGTMVLLGDWLIVAGNVASKTSSSSARKGRRGSTNGMDSWPDLAMLPGCT